jgi:diguanylate cyclase
MDNLLESTTILALIATAVPGLLCGMVMGWYARGTPETPAEPAKEVVVPPAETAAPAPAAPAPLVRNMLSRLHELADSASRGVGQHAARVEAINRQLNSLSSAPADQLENTVIEAAAQLLLANEQLEAELAATRSRLDEHGRQLEARMSEARTDGLVGVANRRALDDELNRSFEAFRASGANFSLLLLDIDRFKLFNDRHGHQAGDEVLRGVARALRQTVGTAGFVARYGGEEFAVLLPGAVMCEGAGLAERARQAIAAAKFSFQEKELRVTVSFGVAEAAIAGENLKALIHRTDEALYAAKKAGRDRVYVFNGSVCEAANRALERAARPAQLQA